MSRLFRTTLNRVGLAMVAAGVATQTYLVVRYGWPVMLPGAVAVLGVVVMEGFRDG